MASMVEVSDPAVVETLKLSTRLDAASVQVKEFMTRMIKLIWLCSSVCYFRGTLSPSATKEFP